MNYFRFALWFVGLIGLLGYLMALWERFYERQIARKQEEEWRKWFCRWDERGMSERTTEVFEVWRGRS